MIVRQVDMLKYLVHKFDRLEYFTNENLFEDICWPNCLIFKRENINVVKTVLFSICNVVLF